ncbi:Subtilisin-like protein protease [Cinnamomum micranthum f. kanehirae]|uniref:Subtilisin-like protein protease n=1 Tax=Cinnamomum micranthum f. kanehirae TaxID=337451 RepID=A0A443NRT4_9MAGN|nr:Subtilisin-like protein protease [Cinnamomum micranthum f. kanehirae]
MIDEAIMDCIHDGVDVISISFCHMGNEIAQCYFEAVTNGITVTCCAGNLGPGECLEDTPVKNSFPWFMTEQFQLNSLKLGKSLKNPSSPKPVKRSLAGTQVVFMRCPARVAWFSLRGPRFDSAGFKPDITAPGVNILAAKFNYFEFESGTSMATLFIAALADDYGNSIMVEELWKKHQGNLEGRLVMVVPFGDGSGLVKPQQGI